MNLEQFLSISGPKYIIVASVVHESDELSKSIAPEPRKFTLDGTEFVAINVEPLYIPELAEYIQRQAGIEFEFVRETGNASFLTHSQVIELLKGEETDGSQD
jgi:hypothetical protein